LGKVEPNFEPLGKVEPNFEPLGKVEPNFEPLGKVDPKPFAPLFLSTLSQRFLAPPFIKVDLDGWYELPV